MGDVGPQFLDGTSPAPPATAGAGHAGHRHRRRPTWWRTAHGDLPARRHDPTTCVYSGVPSGSRIIVVNVANDRSIDVLDGAAPDRRAAGRDGDERRRRSPRSPTPRRRRSTSRSGSRDRRGAGVPRAAPPMTHSRPAVRELLTTHGLAPRRDLGQNFVADPNTVRRIAHLAGVGPGDRVVEIGAGLGSLTLALAETGATVTAVEVDRGLAAVLREVVADVAARHGRRGRRDDARLAGAARRRRPVGARRQPPVQRGDAARAATCSTACRRSSGCS